MESVVEYLKVDSSFDACEYHLRYRLRYASHVRIEITNGCGRPIQCLLDKLKESGTHRAIWRIDNTRDLAGSNGTYHVRMTLQAARGQVTVRSRDVTRLLS